ncbi:MAG: protein kinase, partial [Verrucomicrobiota bacterium]|nr:protein kinase [Verrucomicrobiota bacterium]
MRDLSGELTDAMPTVVESLAACERCGTKVRVAGGACLSCLLLEGTTDNGESSSEAFEEVLAGIDIPDAQWQLGNYLILGEIGRGGMGIIYRAQQRHSRRIVAVKRVLGYHADSHERIERFRREAEAAASLDHPNILPIYEVGESTDGCPFFSMKWATGGSLRDVGPSLRDKPREIVALMAKVVGAIEFAHERGILHRDLQPGNILLDGHGEPLVSDFGLAKWLDEESDLTRTQSAFGTPGFVAPEQADGNASSVSAAADIYSLGAILFHLLAGRPPFVGTSSLHVLRQAADATAPRLRSLVPTMDRDLETIVARCLEPEPRARYSSAADLREDLDHWLAGRPILARPVLPPTRVWRWARRNPALAGFGAVCLMLVTSVVFLLREANPGASANAAAAPEKSVAVLPFENLDHNPENAFFTDGIQEDILTSLAKLADLKVISRSSVRSFAANEPRNLAAVGRTLNVRYILEGSVRRSADRVRVSAHLTEAATGDQLWADQFDRELKDVFAIQSGIAKEIATQLEAHLSPAEAATIEARPTQDLAAYELYLHAKEIAQRAGLSTNERVERAVSLLEQAIARDPAFVPALCLLARLHVQSYWSNHDHTPARLAAAQKALDAAEQLQPNAGEVHLTRAILHYWGRREYEPALAELQLAGRALPNDADIPYFTGLILRRQGKWAESTRELETARARDPRNEVVLFDLARTNYFALKQYRKARELCDSVIAWKPSAFDFQLARAKVELASRAETQRWSDLVWGPLANSAEPDLLAFERLELAVINRNYDAAARALAAQSLPEFSWSGYVTPREWYAGLIALGRGDAEGARAAFSAARTLLEQTVAARPDDAKALIVLAEIEARLGDPEAILAGERALEMRPIAKDAVDGPNIMGRLAGIYAQLGQKDYALDLLEVAAR